MANFSLEDMAWVRASSFKHGLTLISNGSEAVSFYTTRGSANAPFITSLAQLIIESHTLRAINLRGSSIGCDGCEVLCKAFMSSTSLMIIVLDACNISSRGAEALAKVIESNHYLLCLNAFNNNFNLSSLKNFEKALRKNNSLVKFNLSIMGTECTDTLIRIHSKLSKNQKRRKEEFFKAFQNATNTQPWKKSRLMIVGQGRAGKTALVRSFHDMNFEEFSESTIGAELKTSEITFGHSFVGYSNRSPKEYQHTKSLAARLVFKGLERLSFRKSNRNGSKPNTRKASSGPGDRGSRSSFFQKMQFPRRRRRRRQRPQVERSRGRLRASQSSFTSIENTLPVDNGTLKKIHEGYNQDVIYKGTLESKENTFTCSVWDYGGQKVFYTLHHLFLTQHGVYVVCFSLSDILQDPENAQSYLKFWLYSLKMHSENAPIFLVATFFDEIQDKEALTVVNSFITELIEDKFPLIQPNNTESLMFFPVSNKTKYGIVDLREQIIDTALQQEHVNFVVSLNWTLLLDEIQRAGNYISLERIIELGKHRGVTTKGEIDKLLYLFHQLGLIVHLKKTHVLAQTVVTHPQWLIDVLTRVLRDQKVHSPFIPNIVQKAQLESDLDRLYSSGIASLDILNCLWESNEVDFLIDLMKHAMLLAEWKYIDTAGTKLYLIPSLLKKKKSINFDIFMNRKTPLEEKGVPCNLDFSQNFLPHGVFERLICLLVDHSYAMNSTTEPELASNWARINVSDNNFLELQVVPKLDKIEVFISNQLMASSFVMLISSMLFKLRQDVMENLSWLFQVYIEETKSFIPYKVAVENQIQPWLGDTKQIRLSKELSTFDLKGFLGIAEEIFNNDEEEVFDELPNTCN